MTFRLLRAIALAAILPVALPAQGKDILVVANKQDATATLFDVASGATLATLPTGNGPHEAAASPDGKWALVANYGGAGQAGSSLTLIDLAARTVTRTINVAPYMRPHGVVWLPGGREAVVTSEATQNLVVVDLEKGEVTTNISTGQAGSHMVAVTADGRRAFTANIFAGSITELDLERRITGRTLAVAPRTEGIGVTPDGREVWVGSNDNHTVTVIDTRTWAPVATISTPGLPYRINMTPDGRTAVVTCPMDGVVRLIDVATRKERATVQLGGAQPVGASVSADGRHAFIALQGTSEAVMVQLSDGKEVKRFRTGAGPDGIAVARQGS